MAGHRTLLVCSLAVVVLCLPILTYGEYLKEPVGGGAQPDVDKSFPNATCWLATSANMLAAAGYGDGATPQARALDIYGELVGWYGYYQ